MGEEYSVVYEFAYLGKQYKYDLMTKSKISNVVDEDRRRVVSEIAFIGAVLLDYIKRRNAVKAKIDNCSKEPANVKYLRQLIADTQGKVPEKVTKTEIYEGLDLLPVYVNLNAEAIGLDEKIAELEHIKWTLISKSKMLEKIRE